MEIDHYDDPMLEEYWNWFTEDDINDMKMYAKIVAVPTAIFITLQVINYFLNKKA